MARQNDQQERRCWQYDKRAKQAGGENATFTTNTSEISPGEVQSDNQQEQERNGGNAQI